MQDVATKVGVSRTTVSFVLNGRDMNIPDSTKERIWDAVNELGYRPNTLARSLRADRTNTIGFISDSIGTTPYAGEILQGAQDRAWEDKVLLLSINTNGKGDLKQTAVNMLLDRQVDGIIYGAMYHRPVTPPTNILEVPTVLLDCYAEDQSLPSVVPNEVKGGYDATKHLLEKGHRRIGHITAIKDTAAKIGRLNGYRQALAEFDVPFDPTLVVMGEALPVGGYDATKELMQRADRPTALFCYNDRIVMGVYNALHNLNLSIPDDVAIVGFDNHEIIAAHLYPALTTMALPHYAMGKWAMEHLLGLIEGADNEPKQKMLDCPLVVREST